MSAVSGGKVSLIPTQRMSCNGGKMGFMRDAEQLTSTQQVNLEQICQRSETARKTYELTQQFMRMHSPRRGQDFEIWFDAVQASQIPALHRFARSLLRDKDAVVAGLTLPYSNGPVEAQVHKLKLVKRSMYGRAKLPLLRQRLLHAA
jgi:transposase